MIINSVLCMLYYNVIISWALFYFISSFRTNLLWKNCGYWWNDNRCFVPGINCTDPQYANQATYGCLASNSVNRVTATQQFYL
jgi:hypothetical protein